MTAGENQDLAERVREALQVVIDPEIGHNIVDLGLVYDVTAEQDGAVRITMTTTTRGCPASAYLRDGAHEAAQQVAGVRSVEVELTYEPPWTPEMMSLAAKTNLGIMTGDGW
jgi:metal-sulfur cluster biosynthetic enzyme